MKKMLRNFMRKTPPIIIGMALITANLVYASNDDKNESEDRDDNVSKTMLKSEEKVTDHKILEGVVIKVKLNKKEIYFQSLRGREEVYLEKDFVVQKGTTKLKLEDLKEGMKIKITDKKLVEVF